MSDETRDRNSADSSNNDATGKAATDEAAADGAAADTRAHDSADTTRTDEADHGVPTTIEDAEATQRTYLENRSKAYRSLVAAEGIIAGVLLLALLGLIVLQVISRSLFDTPPSWTEELARFTLVWMAFVAAGFVMARRLHITVDLLAARLSHRAAVALDVFAHALVVIVSAAMTVAAVSFAIQLWFLRAPATNLPSALLYVAGAIGFGLITLHALCNLYVNLKHPDEVPEAQSNLEAEAI